MPVETVISFSSAVGSFEANAWGVYDMLGNAWEWTTNCWRDRYDPSKRVIANADGCGQRTLRGGAWANHPAWVRSAKRFQGNPKLRIVGVTFRVTRQF